MSDDCVLPPSFVYNQAFGKTATCQNRAVDLLRIDNQVRMPSSLKTMLLTSVCKPQLKDPKFFSYDRVYMRRRADGNIQSADTKCNTSPK